MAGRRGRDSGRAVRLDGDPHFLPLHSSIRPQAALRVAPRPSARTPASERRFQSSAPISWPLVAVAVAGDDQGGGWQEPRACRPALISWSVLTIPYPDDPAEFFLVALILVAVARLIFGGDGGSGEARRRSNSGAKWRCCGPRTRRTSRFSNASGANSKRRGAGSFPARGGGHTALAPGRGRSLAPPRRGGDGRPVPS